MDKRSYEILYYTIDPIESEIAQQLKNKLTAVYTQIKSKAYFVTNDVIKIYHDDSSPPFKLYRVPAALIAAHLVNKSSTMLEGAPGSGKTKIAKITSRLMTGSSLNDVENIIYCDEELSKEKWMAFPDIKKMIGTSDGTMHSALAAIESWISADGVEDALKTVKIDPKQVKSFISLLSKAANINDTVKESDFEVIWSPFFRVSRKGMDLIVDEINRTNPKTQNEFLSLMAEGIVQYAVPARVKVEDFRLFFTQNPLDDMMAGDGIYQLGHAFKDRITQSVQVPQPPMYAMKMVSDVRKDDRNYEYDEDMEIVPVMTDDEVRSATILASKVPVTETAKRYARYIARDLSLCLKAPGNDKSLSKIEMAGRGLCNGCHFSGNTKYRCRDFLGGSMRMYNDLIAMGKAYSFWLGLKEVNEHVIKSIAIDIISHRVHILPEKLRDDQKYGKDARKYLQHHLIDWCFSLLQSRKAAEQAYENLYHGKSVKPEEDIEIIKLNAQNDLYVRIDLLPRVMEIDTDEWENLIENKTPVLSSTNDQRYRQAVVTIKKIMDDGGLNYKQKRDKLSSLAEAIAADTIPFSSNLIDMIYSMYPILDESRARERIRQDEINRMRTT